MIVLVARKKTYGSFQIGGEVLSYNRVVVVGGWWLVVGGWCVVGSVEEEQQPASETPWKLKLQITFTVSTAAVSGTSFTQIPDLRK
jgi:hypothetical protein